MLFANGLIGLREGLEAALVVSILVAFLVKSDRRSALRWVWLGVAAAIVLSIAVGALLTYGTNRLTFEQSEAVGGTLSIVAVAFVTGMIFWMRKAARTMSSQLRDQLAAAVDVGPLAVAVVAFLSVGREGLETAFFFYAAAEAAGGGTVRPLLGFLIGITIAIAIGIGLYRRALRINLTMFFRITGVLLIIVAAGILAYGLHDLQEAAIIPGLNTLAFDVSSVIPPDSWYGTLLKGFFNFSPQTTVVEAVAWVLYVAVVLTAFLWPARTSAPASPAPAPAS